ncbi:energy transducer TonB [Campylobacter gastrosuis]|uniref:Energy transducer TonB n=1 Tax=Campylobacter gastrosuis TaxID=2974576 RepID=A0ABT7HMG3_9BACT|nr:energy transducer TonB [Campylobacter gastrosuis]MDL0087917.1 energy transducer TonB [Campylobacter gastrosuis]
MLSQLYFNRATIGFVISFITHFLLGFYIYENHKILKIKPNEERSLKIDLLSYKPVSTPVVEQIQKEQITPPEPVITPPEPPKVVEKIVKKEHKKPEKKHEKKPAKEIVKKQNFTPEPPPAKPVVQEPVQTQQVAQVIQTQTTPQIQPKAQEIGEFNIKSSANDTNFMQIRKAIEKHKKYPKNAQKMRQQGLAEVSFLYKKNGLIAEIKIVKSSGFSSLDEGAIKCIERAASEFPLLDKDYHITIPIGFRLI